MAERKPHDEAGAGWLEAGARVTRALLGSSAVKDRLAVVLRYVDPDGAPALVRALLWTDAALTLSALRALPEVANAGIEGLRELLVQLESIPPMAMEAGLRGAAGRVRVRTLGEVVGRALGWAVRLRWATRHAEVERASLAAPFFEGVAEGLEAMGVSPASARRRLLVEPCRALADAIERAKEASPEAAAEVIDALHGVVASLQRPEKPRKRRS